MAKYVDIYFIEEYIMNLVADNFFSTNKHHKEADYMIFMAEVVITPREGVLDTQGKAVEKTLTHLGYKGLSEVRVGKIIRLRLEAAGEKEAVKILESICSDLLCNDLIETFNISVREAGQ